MRLDGRKVIQPVKSTWSICIFELIFVYLSLKAASWTLLREIIRDTKRTLTSFSCIFNECETRHFNYELKILETRDNMRKLWENLRKKYEKIFFADKVTTVTYNFVCYLVNITSSQLASSLSFVDYSFRVIHKNYLGTLMAQHFLCF